MNVTVVYSPNSLSGICEQGIGNRLILGCKQLETLLF